MKIIDLKGQTFGQWKILRRAPSNGNGEAMWWCKCLCSPRCVRKAIASASLRRGNSTSCGKRTKFRAGWSVHKQRLQEISKIQRALNRLIIRVRALIETEPRRRK